VGGIKEKVLGAHRAGITTVILPAPNQVDLEDVPVEVRTHMIFAPVERVEQAIQLALEETPMQIGKAEEEEAVEDNGTPEAIGESLADEETEVAPPEKQPAPKRPEIAARVPAPRSMGSP